MPWPTIVALTIKYAALNGSEIFKIFAKSKFRLITTTVTENMSNLVNLANFINQTIRLNVSNCLNIRINM